jgi:hypothetical protein
MQYLHFLGRSVVAVKWRDFIGLEENEAEGVGQSGMRNEGGMV